MAKVVRLAKGVLKRFTGGRTVGAQDDDDLVELAKVLDEISSWLLEVQDARRLRSSLDADRNSKQLERYNRLLDDIISQVQLDITLDIQKTITNLYIAQGAPPTTLVVPIDIPLVEVPPNPLFVYGRDERLKFARKALLRSPSDPIAILGGGGMGKTTFAVSLLHDETVVAEFGRNRVFVSCDGVPTADGITSAMLTLLFISAPQGVTPLQALVLHLRSLQPRAFVVLDNLESAWDTSQREAVEALLTNLCNIPTLALVITMRGAQTPRGQRWLSFDPLEKLTLEDARSLFVDISHVSDEKLDELLGHLDGLPLAVTLMAELGKSTAGNTPSKLLRSYLSEKTSMIGTGINDRSSSLDVSIMVSLSSRTMKQNPDALELLRLLCLLPDGVRYGDLASMFPLMKRHYGAAHILHAVALATYVDDVTRVLAPIRDFIQVKYPPAGVHLVAMQNYFIRLASSGEWNPPVPPQALVHTLLNQMANLQSVLMHALAAPTDEGNLLDAVINLSSISFYSEVGDCSTLLYAVLSMEKGQSGPAQALPEPIANHAGPIRRRLPFARRFRRPAQEPIRPKAVESRHKIAECARQLGTSLRYKHRFSEALKVLDEAKSMFEELGDRKGIASCLSHVGNILRVQDEHEEALRVLNEAKAAYLEVGDRDGVALCLWSLGDVQRLQGNHDEAVALLEQANAAYKDLGYGEGLATGLYSLGEILTQRGEYDKAVDLFNEAKPLYLADGNRSGVAECIGSLADVLRIQGKYDRAIDLLKEANAICTEVGHRLGLAQCTRIMGKTRQAQGDLDQATVLFSQARSLYLAMEMGQEIYECQMRLDELSKLRAQQEHDRPSESQSPEKA